jgi:hypothetical protein
LTALFGLKVLFLFVEQGVFNKKGCLIK